MSSTIKSIKTLKRNNTHHTRMSPTSRNLLTNFRPLIFFRSFNPNFKNPSFFPLSPFTLFTNTPYLQIPKSHSLNKSFYTHLGPIRAFQSHSRIIDNEQDDDTIDNFDFDSFLSIAEILCLATSGVISIGCILNSQKPILVGLGNKVFVWQFVLLGVGMVMGSVIRRRQWRRVCMDSSKPGGSGVDLVGRIEKLEEDLGSSATVARVMSRQLEKLGIRFRITRKALKEPIAEIAALAQKNSEATRALAVKEDILEKELGEIQNVLLAMQEQQQKQFELILAIGKSGKLLDSRRDPGQDQDKVETHNSGTEEIKQMAPNQIQALAGKEISNDEV